ncbi:hypothetical protein FX983_06568 [Pseudomonas frederiksbergensis]|uniref:Uncharacterized protein n=1 Tax=Pseudomonas frederiksbergensis TaxID=104087 RepID=A0A6L5BMX8_9PSED|nr:hypothetical protein FX983_06568 [Pseudomonas frederiksbergensis]
MRRGVVRDQTFIAGDVFAGQDHGFVDVDVLREFGFDLAEFDAEAADFDLIVVAAQVFDVAVGQVAAQIARSIHPAVSAEWIGEEALCSQVVAVKVTARHAGAADVDFTRNAKWHRLTVFIQQVELGVGHGFADVCGEAILAIHRHPA